MTVSDRRRALRALSRDDPMARQETQPQEVGIVQVGDGQPTTEPADMTYQGDRFGNPIKTSVIVAESEDIRPNLEVGADKINYHRRQLRRLTDLG